MSSPAPDSADVTLPEGVAPADVEIISDVEGLVLPNTESNPDDYERPFNPQNGRYYETHDPGCASYDSPKVVGGLEVNCAYEDCSGRTNVVVEGEVNDVCDQCGEAQMGRHQFSTESTRTRQNYGTIRERVKLHDDEYVQEMDRLTDAGVGPAAAMDYLMCSVGDVSAERWALARDVQKQTVSDNMKRVATKLGETVRYTQ